MKSKNLSFKSFILSTVVFLLGALCFGFFYYIGYFVYAIPVIQCILATSVFLKNSKSSKLNNVLAFLWCIVWSLAFNIASVLLAENLILVNLTGFSFIQCINIFLDYMQNNLELKNAITAELTKTCLTTFVGAVLSLIYLILHFKKKKQPTDATNSQANITKTQELHSKLLFAVKKCNEQYTKSKDKEVFKANLNIVFQHIKKQPLSVKKELKDINDKEMQNPDINILDENLLIILSKLIEKATE